MAEYVKCYALAIGSGDTYEANEITFTDSDELGRVARFVQISTKENAEIRVRLNGSNDAIFTVEGNSTQIFNRGDLKISKLAFDNTASGGSPSVDVEVIAAR